MDSGLIVKTWNLRDFSLILKGSSLLWTAELVLDKLIEIRTSKLGPHILSYKKNLLEILICVL